MCVVCVCMHVGMCLHAYAASTHTHWAISPVQLQVTFNVRFIFETTAFFSSVRGIHEDIY